MLLVFYLLAVAFVRRVASGIEILARASQGEILATSNGENDDFVGFLWLASTTETDVCFSFLRANNERDHRFRPHLRAAILSQILYLNSPLEADQWPSGEKEREREKIPKR